jgi:hypothetical protein
MRKYALFITIVVSLVLLPFSSWSQEEALSDRVLDQLQTVNDLLARSATARDEIELRRHELDQAGDVLSGTAGALVSGLFMFGLCSSIGIHPSACTSMAAATTLSASSSKLESKRAQLEEIAASTRVLERKAHQLLEEVILLQRLNKIERVLPRVEDFDLEIGKLSQEFASVESGLAQLVDCPGPGCPSLQ